ncbi:hypothetical protein [Jiangella asiatica]|uniref:Uncharacterized protein n=1 Tax=Jiangella asiatica TaxID=2530372 RepID=A0A4R5D642_9ACTN|nr:hypothetical protein [Jiangella asiatica]TDE08037.1 hypothetical protein E1269_19085 [Jiangella asiatica]
MTTLSLTTAALLLAGCGDDDSPAGDDSSPAAAGSGAPSNASSTEPTEDESGDPLLMALEALAADFDGAKDCSSEEPPEVFDASDQNLVAGAEWFGTPSTDASGARPAAAWNADFCLPESEELATRVALDILEFDAEDDASAWLEDLETATASGQVVVRGEPEPSECGAENPKTATLTEPSVAGDDAVDVVVADPCGPLAKFPELEWDNPTYSFGQGGRWVVITFVEVSGGGTTQVGDDQMILEMVKVRKVEPDLQRAAVETLTEELADA